MEGTFIKRIAAVLFALVLCTILLTPSNGSEKPGRGDYPQCQDKCVTQLEKRMTDLSEEYKKQGGRLSYEERVEQARSDYDSCINRCKEPLPVK